MQQQKIANRIRTTANIGLFGSMIVVILSIIAKYMFPSAVFIGNEQTSRWLIIAGTILAVLCIAMVMLVVRKKVPSIRQTDDVNIKLSAYLSHVRSVFFTILSVVIILSVLMFLTGNNVLLMFAMISVLLLFLNYPNIYRIKVDLGFNDEQMTSLFGDKYIPDGDK